MSARMAGAQKQKRHLRVLFQVGGRPLKLKAPRWQQTPGWGTIRKLLPDCLLRAVVLQDLLGVVVLDGGIVVQRLVVGHLQQLFTTIPKLLPDRLLYSRIV